MTQTILDNQALAQLELSAYIQNQSETASEFEIDADYDPDFGTLYRVWGGSIGINLLGTFYRATDEKWIAQPCNSKDKPRCNTAEEAQLLIMAMSGSLVADSPKDFIDLLDKPFDELTVADWEASSDRGDGILSTPSSCPSPPSLFIS